ncbi:MAG: DinB family protein [Chloroflexi bacterium]|nr:DinB family protein [Chloroflexota bacterium]MBU1749604.1 DinB family protein [Chloroflexota bacterium]MBU1880263.1 DinB family protein [Chloroflexota bacterium]
MTEQTIDPATVLASYAAGPAQLRAAIAGLSELDLDLALSADSWTIRQIVHHLADGDDIWKTCIKAALGNPDAAFSLPWYWDIPQDEWVQHWHYAGRAVEPSLALLEANRAHMVQLLEQVPGAGERRVVILDPDGEEHETTVGWVVAMQARHVAGHIDDIRAIREAHGL